MCQSDQYSYNTNLQGQGRDHGCSMSHICTKVRGMLNKIVHVPINMEDECQHSVIFPQPKWPYAKNGWLVEYKSLLGFNKHFRFTPLPKSSQRLRNNQFSNLDLE